MATALMDGEVSAAVWAAMSYARLAAARLRPGAPRLLALLPVVALLCAIPFAFSTSTFRGTSAFFLSWLGSFKLLLLAAGIGPLDDPSLRLSHFVCSAALPVKLRRQSKEKSQAPVRGPARILLCGAVIPGIIYAYQFKSSMSRYQLLALYTLHIYFSLDLLLAATHTVIHDLLGMEMEPQVDYPYLASSLRDFWGRRWNLMVPSILRPSVFRPVRAHLGTAAGVLATFLVSGLMHELMFYYIMRSTPSGEVTAFFLLHGACTAAEGWWASHAGWCRSRSPSWAGRGSGSSSRPWSRAALTRWCCRSARAWWCSWSRPPGGSPAPQISSRQPCDFEQAACNAGWLCA